jgi:predicted transcriptional regulator
MPPPHPVAVKLDPEVHVRLRALARAQQRSAHFLMREAIAQYVAREEQREALRQDALRAWAGYQDTGLHVTGAEADDWLARLEAGDDVEPPESHG